MLLFITLLFIILSPGLLVTVPPGPKGIKFSEETSPLAVLVHAVAFFAVLSAVNTDFLGLGILNKLDSTLLGYNY
jgi:hypothetical protein